MIDPRRLKYVMDGMGFNVPDTTQRILELSDEWMRKDSDRILVPWNIIAEAAHLFDEQGWTSRGDECRTLLHGPAPTPATQENAMTDDSEPPLPEGVKIDEDGDYDKDEGDYCIDMLIGKKWVPSELRAIADHMEWRERQAAKQKVPDESEVRSLAYNAAYDSLLCESSFDKTQSHVIAKAIAAALACAKKEKQ